MAQMHQATIASTASKPPSPALGARYYLGITGTCSRRLSAALAYGQSARLWGVAGRCALCARSRRRSSHGPPRDRKPHPRLASAALTRGVLSGRPVRLSQHTW